VTDLSVLATLGCGLLGRPIIDFGFN